LLGQSTFMGAIAFVAGPLLAILLVILLSMITLDAHEREALQLITAHPLTVVQGLLGRDLLIIGIALVAMILAIWRVMSSNVLSAQRESARSTQRPFWIRFKLDILAAVIALVGFSISLYITSPGVLNLRTRTLILPVTSLVGTLALLTGCVLLFLRIFMPILRWGERMAARNRGAAPLLAMAQLARSPQQPLRVTLLFALAVAFAIFTQIFNATQTQRLADITTYQVGSDFSGTIPSVLSGEDLGSQQAFYREIKGITSATLGDRTQMTGGSNQGILVDLEAVDSSTYAHTFYWTAQESGNQSISTLMSRLQKSYPDAVKHNVIPAILDDLAAKSLNVTVGQQFALSDFHGPMSYVVLAIVHYMPTIYDSIDSAGTDSSISQGGVLVDFATYRDIAMAVNSNGVSATVAWLRADNSSADVANARKTLFSGLYTFENGLDRQQLTSELADDPLYATIIGILAIGAAIALLLGLAGNLIVSWLNVRRRRVHFAVLRALGCGPGQIARVLIWEQAIVYSTALVLGIFLSILFSLNILPAFIFSPLVNSDTAEAFYVIQSVPPVQIVLPVLPLLYTMVGLILVCILAISMMQRIVSHPRLGQILRINEE
ncbi:MAG TPA: FtsX-like permease family protein, partial [Ktedonobacteraceae bacterium]|nr:FtsX-like permease family protein [Ktedonobacteraceae bacterium]